MIDNDGDVKGTCLRHHGTLIFSGVPPYGHCAICTRYNKHPKYEGIKYNECIFCEYWNGELYEDIMKDYITMKSAKNLQRIKINLKKLSIPKEEKPFNRFADLDYS
jgi:hypothetical protein